MAPVTPFLLRLTRLLPWNTLGNSEHRRKSLDVFRGTLPTLLFGPHQTRGPDRIWGRRNEMRSVLGRPERVLGVGITWKMLEDYWVGKRLSTGVRDGRAEGGGRRAEESHGDAVCGVGGPTRPGEVPAATRR